MLRPTIHTLSRLEMSTIEGIEVPEVLISEDETVSTERAADMTIYWSILATEMITGEQSHRLLTDDVYERVLDNWKNLGESDLTQLCYKNSLLGDIVTNEVTLRAFFLFYHRYLLEARASDAQSACPHSGVFLESALKEWKAQDDAKLEYWKQDAVRHLYTHKIPEPPEHRLITPAPQRAIPSGSGISMPALDTGNAEAMLPVTGIERLERMANVYQKFSILLQHEFTSSSAYCQKRWLNRIERAQEYLNERNTYIAIAGATGAGKSSIINAILDESILAPTSCWRACTATVTIIKFNKTGTQPYRAAVDFMKKSDWEAELRILFSEILDSVGRVSMECDDKSTEAGVALEKVLALYPGLSRSHLPGIRIESLLEHETVASLLDNKLEFEADTAEELHLNLCKFVDSGDRPGSQPSGSVPTPALWPIVRSVELYAKSALLKDGLTLVDLPGTHDSNKARDAIAKEYLRKCSNIWIVAPLTRAVDDRSAKELLGDAFKRQMKLDGIHDKITFIGSKSDDIGPIREAVPSLGLAENIQKLDMQQADLSKKMKNLKQEHDSNLNVHQQSENFIRGVEAQIKVLSDLQKQLQPSDSIANLNKRKRAASDAECRERGLDAENTSSTIENPEDVGSEDQQAITQPIQLNLIGRITELEEIIQTRRRETADLNAKIHEQGISKHQADLEYQNLDSEKWRMCVAARNKIACNTIKSDFASGLRDHDEQLAQETPNFDPDVNRRDYKKLGEELPVFCVSSRGYQRLSNVPSEKEMAADQFSRTAQTEIPALQQHAIKLSKDSHRQHLTSYVLRIQQVINSLRLWASGDSLGQSLAGEQLVEEQKRITNDLQNLHQTVILGSNQCVESILKSIQNNIYCLLPEAQNSARSGALTTIKSWGAPTKDGGLLCGTYKAILKRGGIFSNSKSYYNFNDELAKPMTDAVTLGWDRTFHTQLPDLVKTTSFATNCKIDEFHSRYEKRIRLFSENEGIFAVLHNQSTNHQEALDRAFSDMKQMMLDRAKEANRRFVSTVEQDMQSTYKIASKMRGGGSFQQIKDTIRWKIEQDGLKIYQKAARNVQDILDKMMVKGGETLAANVSSVLESIEQDYTSAFSSQIDDLSSEEQELRTDIMTLLGQHADQLAECDAVMIDLANASNSIALS